MLKKTEKSELIPSPFALSNHNKSKRKTLSPFMNNFTCNPQFYLQYVFQFHQLSKNNRKREIDLEKL